MPTQNLENKEHFTPDNAVLISTGHSGAQTIKVSEFTTFGRDTLNTIPLSDPFVSARHARIEKSKKGFILRDLQSRNGTFLNGARIIEALLKPGDRLSIGKCEYIFQNNVPKNTENRILKSKNTKWNNILKTLPEFAQTDLPVLLLGNSGTGKEIVAQAIHENSTRTRGPFVSVNCSALSDTLIESELFGHKKGSFTGATGDREGAFQAARKGTLFLDEIGDLPITLQPKLLRALENCEIRPVGSDRNFKTDVRIIAATHKNLQTQVSKGRFRSDLFYRLHVIKIQIPSLKERMEDFDFFLSQFAREMRVCFSYNAVQKLKKHSWPGNVRELKNVVARASAFYPKTEILPKHIRSLIDEIPGIEKIPISQIIKERNSLKEIECEMIKEKLIEMEGNQRKVAKDLGIAKSTLHDRIKNYNIDVSSL